VAVWGCPSDGLTVQSVEGRHKRVQDNNLRVPDHTHPSQGMQEGGGSDDPPPS